MQSFDMIAMIFLMYRKFYVQNCIHNRLFVDIRDKKATVLLYLSVKRRSKGAAS